MTDPSPYTAPPAAYPTAYTPYPAAPKTNALALTSLIAGIAGFVILPLIAPIVAVITGHIALRQVRATGENGHGFAVAGVILGWVGVGLAILGIVLAVVWFVFIFSVMGMASTYN